MNKQDEEKARELAIKSTRDVDGNGNEVYNVFVEAALQEMATWKKRQMIEKAVKYLDNMLILDDGSTDAFIENFKNYMEEN